MTSEQLKVLIYQARNVAISAHLGQVRSTGADYFKAHVEPVALSVEDHLKPIAYLHDVVEEIICHNVKLFTVDFLVFNRVTQFVAHRNCQ